MHLHLFAVAAFAFSSLVGAASNNTYRWIVGNIAVQKTTSEFADTLSLYATVTYLGGKEIARKNVFLGDVRRFTQLTANDIGFQLDFTAPPTSNISIIWSLVNSARSDHAFTQNVKHLANDTLAVVGASGELQDALSKVTDKLKSFLSPETIGGTIGGAAFGPLGFVVGTAIGAVVDQVLGDLIDDFFGCDCNVASDTITFLPGDQSLLPIQHTASYSGGGSGFGCGSSTYNISSTLSLLSGKLNGVSSALNSHPNWTISLLDSEVNYNYDYDIYNVGDVLYMLGGSGLQAWTTSSGDTGVLYRIGIDFDIDHPVGFTQGQLLAFGPAITDDSGGFKTALFSQSLSLNTSVGQCQLYSGCPSNTKVLLPAASLPANLQYSNPSTTLMSSTQFFLSGLSAHDGTYTKEAYIIDYVRGTVRRLPDVPFALGSGFVVFTESWAKPLIFAYRGSQMTHYDPSTNKWSKPVAVPDLDPGVNFCFDGLNTLLFTYPLLYDDTNGLASGQYGLSNLYLSLNRTVTILALTLNETHPNVVVFTSHFVTPPSDTQGTSPNDNAPTVYDSLRNRIYIVGGTDDATSYQISYKYAINLNPAAAARQTARPFGGSCQVINGTCAVGHTNSTTTSITRSHSSTSVSKTGTKNSTTTSLAKTSSTASKSMSSFKGANSQMSSGVSTTRTASRVSSSPGR